MKSLYTLLGILLIVSCVEQESVENSLETPITLKMSENKDYQPHKINEALSGDYGKYLDFFVGTDYQIGISSSVDGGLSGKTKISCISGISQVRKADATKSANHQLPLITSSVDGVEISRENIKTTKSLNGIIDCFGKVVEFSFTNHGETKSSEGNEGVVNMYIPKAIEFLFPYAEKEEDLNPLCYYKDFIVRWNKDEENENGVLILVDWNGSMILGNDIPNTHVCRIASFPDTGEAKLPENMFDGIPDTAHCELIILRGNVDNVEHNEYSYKLVGKTHHLISFILIREIKE